METNKVGFSSYEQYMRALKKECKKKGYTQLSNADIKEFILKNNLGIGLGITLQEVRIDVTSIIDLYHQEMSETKNGIDNSEEMIANSDKCTVDILSYEQYLIALEEKIRVNKYEQLPYSQIRKFIIQNKLDIRYGITTKDVHDDEKSILSKYKKENKELLQIDEKEVESDKSVQLHETTETCCNLEKQKVDKEEGINLTENQMQLGEGKSCIHEKVDSGVLNRKIEYWENQLLDLGKRNKMISYRETKRATLKISSPDFEELYNRIVVNEEELTFQRAIDRDSDIRVYSILALLDALSDPVEVNIGDIKAEGSISETKKTLKHLRAKSRLAMDEQGTNILYLVFGFVQWREKGSKEDNWINSPLVLVPVSLVLESLNAPYCLKKHEDEIVVNPTLAYLFERDYGITLPSFDPDEDTIEGFMQEMEKLVDLRGWRVLRECSVGLVSFLKINMYNDLVHNAEDVKANPIIRAFAGERNAVNMISADNYEFNHDAEASADTYQVVNADSSQQDAIMLSKKGISFVMQGPPGTGKSQTITNIIAQGLADGKKILFVSEKMAALEVVYRRLSEVHLADFCLSLHSHKANKKEILEQLENNLNLKKIKVKDEEIAKLTELDLLKESLKDYVKDIHTTIMPIEMSLYEIYGAIAELAEFPDIKIELDNIENYSKDRVNRLAILVADFDKAKTVLGPKWYKNPWQGITGSYMEVSQKRLLKENIDFAIRLIKKLEENPLIQKNLAHIISLNNLDIHWDLFQHARECRMIPASQFQQSIEKEVRILNYLKQKNESINEKKSFLLDSFDKSFFDLNAQETVTILEDAITYLKQNILPDDSENSIIQKNEILLEDFVSLLENTNVLVDATAVISDRLNIENIEQVKSLEKLLEVCELLLEEHALTTHYFGVENLRQVKMLANQLHTWFDEIEDSINVVNNLYVLELLNDDRVASLRDKMVEAARVLKDVALQETSHRAQLNRIIENTTEKTKYVELKLADNLFEEVKDEFGLGAPENYNEVVEQIKGLNTAINGVLSVPYWATTAGRNNAEELLKEAIENYSNLEEKKVLLKDKFNELGFSFDVMCINDETIKAIYLINQKIEEAEKIINYCTEAEVYDYLIDYKRKSKEYIDTIAKIEKLKTEAGIVKEQDNEALLSMFSELQSKLELCNPVNSWVESTEEKTDILDEMVTMANELCSVYREFEGVYEKNVFDLDYIGILNRFKTEYTGFFKRFKSSYREDIKRIKIVYKDIRKTIPDSEIIDLLQKLKGYNELLERYQAKSTEVSSELGVEEYDIWFNWETIRTRIDTFEKVRTVFSSGTDAYEFLNKSKYVAFLDSLKRVFGLNEWFDTNGKELGEKYFGSRYLAKDTNVDAIESDLKHADEMVKNFVSKDAYLSYILKSDNYSAESLAKLGQDIIDSRKWFTKNVDIIREQLNVSYQESMTNWGNVTDNLNKYKDIILIFGENVGVSLLSTNFVQKDKLAAYKTILDQIMIIKDCYMYAKDITTVPEDFYSTNLALLVYEIKNTLAAARSILDVYDFLEGYKQKPFTVERIEDIIEILNKIVAYQFNMKELMEKDVEYAEILGETYASSKTDWKTLQENIGYCEKVHACLNDEINETIIRMFMENEGIYSKHQIEELKAYIEKTDSICGKYKTIEQLPSYRIKNDVLQVAQTKVKKLAEIIQRLSACDLKQGGYQNWMAALKLLEELQETQEKYKRNLNLAADMMPYFSIKEPLDFDYALEKFAHLRDVKRIVNVNQIDDELVKVVTGQVMGKNVTQYYDMLERLVHHKSIFKEFVSLFDRKADMMEYPLNRLKTRLVNCAEQFSTMDEWIDFRDCREVCKTNGLGDFILETEDIVYPDNSLNKVFLKSFYYAWFEKMSSNIETIAKFKARVQNSRIENFREFDAHQLPVAQARIREKLISEMPNKSNYRRAADEMSVLLHELGKKRKIMPIRKLFRTIPNLLLKLKPCLMMSPLSVAYFLEADTYKFDMVIFDEASQIFPQDAIGAIFRGSQVIIAGDSKQLPPTNFFAASTSNDSDYDFDDSEEDNIVYDSILEEATNSLKNHSLLWHYRSKNEDLISFSNQEIYKNNLITFPSSKTNVADSGVEYIYVEKGVYENRCNKEEAKRCVNLVKEHILKHPERSLGIIAFSESQQSVIEDEIHKFRTANPRFEHFFNENKEDAFFVKNLENVQGDERDTIIFSICYGKNATGRMYMRFGPLGHQGGERRLNVAITRAKHNVKLVGSILPEDIDLNKTKSEGVKMLRSYIRFAINGSSMLQNVHKKNSLYEEDTFAKYVGDFLMKRGYNIKMNVGSSDYTIDIAVEHPDYPGNYFAGVECDGNSYYMARTVRDRESLRTSVLEQMGWRMYRVWSTEWIRNTETEERRLLDFLKAALHEYENPIQREYVDYEDTKTEDIVVSVEEQTEIPQSVTIDYNNPYGFEVYQVGSWNAVEKWRNKNSNSMRIADMICAIVKVEQPIHIDLLYRRMAPAFGNEKATQPIRNTVDSVIENYMQTELSIKDSFVSLVSMGEVRVRRSIAGMPDRAIEHVSKEEVALAMERVLKNAFGMERNALILETARIFGFERTGTKIKRVMNEAIDYLENNQIVRVSDDKIQLLGG